MALTGQYRKGNFSKGMAAVLKYGLYKFINTTGTIIISPIFYNARSFTEELAPAANTKSFWGYTDDKGSWVIKTTYDFTDNFEKEKQE